MSSATTSHKLPLVFSGASKPVNGMLLFCFNEEFNFG